jgi:hypothetical protein
MIIAAIGLVFGCVLVGAGFAVYGGRPWQTNKTPL